MKFRACTLFKIGGTVLKEEDRIRLRKPILLANDTTSTNSVVLDAKDERKLRESSQLVNGITSTSCGVVVVEEEER